MKYVITGGCGFIGSHIVDFLAQRGDEVVIIDDLSSGTLENIIRLHNSGAVTFVSGSVTDPVLLKNTFSGADGVFHEAAITSVQQSLRDPVHTHEVNSTGTLNILLAARDSGIKKVVFASSAAVYGDSPALPKREDMLPAPLSPYAITKITGEYYCSVFSSLYGLPTLCLRYFNVFGDRQDPHSEYAAVIPKFITRMLNNESPVIFGDGQQTRDFVFIDDVVRANILGMESSIEGIFNIAGGEQISLNVLVGLLRDLTGSTLDPQYIPPRKGDILHSVADVSRARSKLKFAPEYSIKQGLAKTLDWYSHR
ncbi:MAG: SDR family oxidoreductase [Methanoregula sp.]|jgi:UDP-glucose 4-epimerase|uniref:SDR family oxidoreductase n=1 Tax=Methanoregula sp. TaxID=2052170 RepID=UPI003D10E9F4